MHQVDQINQKFKDIQTIIESKTINDEEKEIKISEIYSKLKRKNQGELKKIFNLDAFKLIQKYINDCPTGLKKILLNIIELVAEKGEQIYHSLNIFDPFFDDINDSDLLNKIEQMIKNKILEEKEKIKYSVETEQLIRIFIQIMKGREYDQLMTDYCVKVVVKNIINISNLINTLNIKVNNKEINNEYANEQIENELKQSSQLIKVSPIIREKDSNGQYDWETRIPNQIIEILKENLYPLIHLNCPPEVNCQQCISIPQSDALIYFQSIVLQSLAQFSCNNLEFKDLLVNDHNIIPHLTHTIISFATQFQLDKKARSFRQQQAQSSSFLPFISSSINLLSNQIQNNSNNQIKEIIQMPKFIHSLLALAIYKSRIHFNSENDKQIYSLRNSSRGCLWTILDYGDALDQQELVNVGIVGVLFIVISSTGGISEERHSEIREELLNIADFLKFLNNGRDITKYPSFPPQPLLAKISIEQIEEEGANEELDAQKTNKGLHGIVKDKSKEVEGLLLNFFIDKSSSKPYWY